MSWGINFSKKIYINGINFISNIFMINKDYNKNPYQVKDAIEDNFKSIEEIKNVIMMYCSSTPKDVCNDPDLSPVEEIFYKVNSNLYDMGKLIEENVLLNLYKEYLEENESKN